MGKTHRVAVIGCGRTGRLHVKGWLSEPRCQLVALADVDRAKAEALAKAHGSDAAIHADYKPMLAAEKPDLVSICLWTKQHLPAIRDCVEAGVLAIHCEKPMAATWGEAQEIAAIAQAWGARVTFSHQRRFAPSYARARELLHGGHLGELERIEAFNPANILDWGTHTVDLVNMYNRETPAKWVMAQLDAREVKKWFDVPFEFALVGSVRFENGVRAVFHSGDDNEFPQGIRLTASRGVIELRGESRLRWLRYGTGIWEDVDFHTGASDHSPIAIAGVVKNLIDTLETGHEPELSLDRALRGTEIIFAMYESCRRRARVDLPLQIPDNPFLAMLEAGEFGKA
ncbi:MAG: Gfo/Idh/MocA family oxidoreductase [Planctomycetes bacterium]|nr:Gfo/Idh/MocA family oxidoreductase [Planctomycetota bacterium]